MLLEEVANEVMENPEKQFSLFGIRDYVLYLGEKHDMIFHVIEGFAPENLKQSSFLTVPVLQHKYPEQSAEAKLYMAELFRGKSFLDTFAVRESGGSTYAVKGRPLNEDLLTFFEARSKPLGAEILKLEDYSRTNEQKLQGYLANWEKVRGYLERLRSKINQEYKI